MTRPDHLLFSSALSVMNARCIFMLFIVSEATFHFFARRTCRLAECDEWFGAMFWEQTRCCVELWFALGVLLSPSSFPLYAFCARLYHQSRCLVFGLKYVVFLSVFSSASCDVVNDSVTFYNGRMNVTYWLIVLLGECCFTSLPRWVLLSESCISWNDQIVLTERVLVKPININLFINHPLCFHFISYYT